MSKSAKEKKGSGAAADEPFDQVLGKLQSVVETLEGGKLSLEQSLSAFEEGARLARRGQQILDSAEKKVEVLVRGDDGNLATEPFAPAQE